MLYYKTIWNHTNDYDPIVMYSSIDEERYEMKRLDIFRDGHVAYFDTRTPMELSEDPYPSDFDEINATDEFDVSEISSIDFENILKMYDTNGLIEDYFSKL
jgi:hypothetical protein